VISHTGPHGTEFNFAPDFYGDLAIYPSDSETAPITIPAADVLDLIVHHFMLKRTVEFLEDPELNTKHVRAARLELHASFEIGPPPKADGD
jgi:hypothetical protein